MPKTSIAALFPGQGALYGRALADLREAFPAVVDPVLRDVGDAARPLLGGAAADALFAERTPEPAQWLAEAPDTLQLAIYTASVATYAVLRSRGLRPGVLVGHSLGEIAALVAAGAFTVAEGARIVCHRGLALREAGPGEKAYMAALSTGPERAQQLVDVVGDPLTGVAVENHAAQTVLSGRAVTLDTVARLAAVLRIDFARLKSPYAFHSPLLGAAAEAFAARIRDVEQRPLEIAVHSPILGRAYEDTDDLTDLLAGHFTRRVRFADAVREVRGSGVGVFVECGALDALSRIVGRVAEQPAVALPALLPEAGGAAALRSALDRLAALGAIPPAAREGDQADPVHAALLADVPAADFAAFWRGRADEVRAFVRRAYDEHTSPAGPAADRGALVRELAGMYAAALEYPAEVFEEGTDLEAELGVDSVKQTELLVRVGERYGLPPRPSDVRPAAYNTLGRIADLILASGAAPAPAAAPDPAPGPAADRGALVRELAGVYAAALEYPAEVFEEGTDLEAELGVDSVKQTELLVRVGDRYGLPPRPSDVRPAAYNTLGKIADLILASAA
ncbi:acyltransferase domain-containing protein [Streptomyces sp. NPDC020983]|uniref:acyltransferase domain-containing protein n=1 Tax=Streptomyces sp. NPDC020983 TaxID=3365106 RepID=UPI0037963248